jgi:hypothetical protein
MIVIVVVLLPAGLLYQGWAYRLSCARVSTDTFAAPGSTAADAPAVPAAHPAEGDLA